MVTAHDILVHQRASRAALTISPLPFLGPIGAVRMALVEGELVINPTLQEAEEADLDLIVVGTKDGLTMVEAGARPGAGGQAPRGARARAPRDHQALRGAERARASKTGKPKWLDPATTERLESHVRPRRLDCASQQQGLREAAARRRGDPRAKEVGPALDGPSTAGERLRSELQVRMSLAAILEKQRAAWPSRPPSASSSRAT